MSDTDRATMAMIAVDSIRSDGGTQPGATLDLEVIGDDQDLYADGVQLPPTTVYCESSNLDRIAAHGGVE